MQKQITCRCEWGDGIWRKFYRNSILTGARPGRGVTHKLTCFRDERVQALRVPELVTPAGGALLQPILLGRAGWRLGGRDTTRGSSATLSSLLRPLSLETHSRASIGKMRVKWWWMQNQESVLEQNRNQKLAWRSNMADIRSQFGRNLSSVLNDQI